VELSERTTPCGVMKTEELGETGKGERAVITLESGEEELERLERGRRRVLPVRRRKGSRDPTVTTLEVRGLRVPIFPSKVRGGGTAIYTHRGEERGEK